MARVEQIVTIVLLPTCARASSPRKPTDNYSYRIASMLPDCLELKNDLRTKLDALFRQKVNRYLEIVAEVPRSVIHEGRRTVIVRGSGSVDETPMFRASTIMTIRPDEIPHITLQEFLDRMDAPARDMAKQISHGFFEQISAAVEKIGHTVDGKGRPFSSELLLETLEKISIEFDEHGKPQMPTLTINPSQMQQVRRVFESIDADPKLSERFKQLIEKKREEWRAREASRKLVG